MLWLKDVDGYILNKVDEIDRIFLLNIYIIVLGFVKVLFYKVKGILFM